MVSKRLMDAGLQKFPSCLAFSRMMTLLPMPCQKAEILALCVIADRLENSESEPVSISLSLPVTA
jgi:hypothetical protein